jgi:hypothetical protein
MPVSPNLAALIVIMLLYVSIGVLAVVGSITVTKSLLPPRIEQAFYALFLVAIATFYLAFTSYFAAGEAWPLEVRAVLAFSVLGLIGLRLPAALIIGYPLHGLWDLLHELQTHGGPASFTPGQSTAIPLAYGAFCATFDFGIAAYFVWRREAWAEARAR